MRCCWRPRIGDRLSNLVSQSKMSELARRLSMLSIIIGGGWVLHEIYRRASCECAQLATIGVGIDRHGKSNVAGF